MRKQKKCTGCGKDVGPEINWWLIGWSWFMWIIVLFAACSAFHHLNQKFFHFENIDTRDILSGSVLFLFFARALRNYDE